MKALNTKIKTKKVVNILNINKIAVGRRIQKIRKNLNFDRHIFALHIGYPVADNSNVLRWEKGQNIPNSSRLKRIAELGEISVDHLLYGNNAKATTKNKDWLKNEIEDQSLLNSLYPKGVKVISVARAQKLIDEMVDTVKHTAPIVEYSKKGMISLNDVKEKFVVGYNIGGVKFYFRNFDPLPTEPFNAIIGSGMEHAQHFENDEEAFAVAKLIDGFVSRLKTKNNLGGKNNEN